MKMGKLPFSIIAERYYHVLLLYLITFYYYKCWHCIHIVWRHVPRKGNMKDLAYV